MIRDCGHQLLMRERDSRKGPRWARPDVVRFHGRCFVRQKAKVQSTKLPIRSGYGDTPSMIERSWLDLDAAEWGLGRMKPFVLPAVCNAYLLTMLMLPAHSTVMYNTRRFTHHGRHATENISRAILHVFPFDLPIWNS